MARTPGEPKPTVSRTFGFWSLDLLLAHFPKRFFRSLCLRTLARLPQSRISHQHRLWFLLESTNNQPQLSPWHCRTRARDSPEVSKSAAERAIGPRARSSAPRSVLHSQPNPFFIGITRKR